MSEKNFVAYGDAESILTGYANRIKQSPTTFVGTQAQWNALSSSQKAEYELVDITDDEFSPSSFVDWESYGKLGAKNLLENEKSTQTISGVTFTVNSDGSVLADGTATDIIWFQINNGFKLNDVEYTLTGCPIGGGENTYEVQIRSTESSSSLWQFIVDRGDGATGLCSSSRTYIAFIGIKSGVTVTNLLFKPMLRLATDSDSTYQPYAMTNKQITPYVQAISNPNLLDNPWFTINQRGWTTGGATKVDTFTVDRWKIEVNNSDHVVTVNNDGTITLTNNSSVGMYFDTAFLLKDFLLDVDTSYTASVDVVSYSGVVNVNIGLMNASPWHRFGNIVINKTGINSATGVVPSDFTGTSFRALCFILNAGASITVRAVKLERGTVSTLAMDTAPNYVSELLKCQRYFVRYKPTNAFAWIGFGIGQNSATDLQAMMEIPVPMRIKPSISFNKVRLWNHTYAADVSSINVSEQCQNKLYLYITPDSSTVIPGAAPVVIWLNHNYGDYIDISADL